MGVESGSITTPASSNSASNGKESAAEVADRGRDALINATVQVVAEHGMRGLTYRTVAKVAGVTHGLVAHHFGSREALITAAFREKARTREASAELNPGTGRVEDIGSNLSAIVESAPYEQRYQYEMILEAMRKPELLEDVQKTYQTFREAIRDELRLAGADDLDALAQVVYAALDGLVIQQLVTGDAQATRVAVARLQSIIKADIAVSRLKESLESRSPNSAL